MPDQIALVTKQVGRKRGKLFDDKAFKADLKRINKNRAAKMKRDFQRTTKTWEHAVTFHQLTEIKPDPTVAVYTEDDQYGYVSVDAGAAGAMSPDFEAKTRPAPWTASPSRRRGLHQPQVESAGIEARNFRGGREEAQTAPAGH